MAPQLRATTFPTTGGAIPGFIAMPAQLPAPAIVIVPPIFGIDEQMRAAATTYAERGFITVVLNPFWRDADPDETPKDADGSARARARSGRFVVDDGLADIRTIVAALAATPAYNGRFAVVGYCFGGRYAFLAATRLGAAAAVAFHGTRVALHLDEAPHVGCPLSFHWGDHDEVAPLAELRAIEAALAGNPTAEICIYPGIHHGFTMPTETHYDPEIARISDERSMRILTALHAGVPA